NAAAEYDVGSKRAPKGHAAVKLTALRPRTGRVLGRSAHHLLADEEYGLRCCQSRVDHDHHVDREAVRERQRLGAAVAAAGKQFERAALAVVSNVAPAWGG